MSTLYYLQSPSKDLDVDCRLNYNSPMVKAVFSPGRRKLFFDAAVLSGFFNKAAFQTKKHMQLYAPYPEFSAECKQEAHCFRANLPCSQAVVSHYRYCRIELYSYIVHVYVNVYMDVKDKITFQSISMHHGHTDLFTWGNLVYPVPFLTCFWEETVELGGNSSEIRENMQSSTQTVA